jgi:hypothetical protein
MINDVPIPVAGWRLLRANIVVALLCMALLIGVDIGAEVLTGETSAVSTIITLLVWAMLLGRFHETALGRSEDLMGLSGTKWPFVWRYAVLLLAFVAVPLIIVAIIFVSAASNASTEADLFAAGGSAAIVGVPLLILSVLGFSLFGTVFPATVDRGKASFGDALSISKDHRGWIFVRLLLWTAGPNVLVIALALGMASFMGEALFVDPQSYLPNVPLILLAFMNNCISAFGTACGAAVFSGVYLLKRDADAQNADLTVNED